MMKKGKYMCQGYTCNIWRTGFVCLTQLFRSGATQLTEQMWYRIRNRTGTLKLDVVGIVPRRIGEQAISC